LRLLLKRRLLFQSTLRGLRGRLHLLLESLGLQGKEGE
jgi:hypothetical protein